MKAENMTPEEIIRKLMEWSQADGSLADSLERQQRSPNSVGIVRFRSEFYRKVAAVMIAALEDSSRFQLLKHTLQNCPHADFRYIAEDMDGDGKAGLWLLDISGCDPIHLECSNLEGLVDALAEIVRKQHPDHP